jgi:hypothetical protein
MVTILQHPHENEGRQNQELQQTSPGANHALLSWDLTADDIIEPRVNYITNQDLSRALEARTAVFRPRLKVALVCVMSYLLCNRVVVNDVQETRVTVVENEGKIPIARQRCVSRTILACS